ncbi:hypothetical protein HAX54_047700, partial [Datura stramonium]|nr:hypothetical protein [Datura stramonium]
MGVESSDIVELPIQMPKGKAVRQTRISNSDKCVHLGTQDTERKWRSTSDVVL